VFAAGATLVELRAQPPQVVVEIGDRVAGRGCEESGKDA
jgi:hypothetical protein